MTPDFSNGLGEKALSQSNVFSKNFHERDIILPLDNVTAYHDPYLLTGEKAMLAVKYLYGQGELFYDDIPHERALLRNQQERRQNGLHGHILKSLRPTSPFYRRSGRE